MIGVTPLAHTRYEYLDDAYFPRVGMLVNGERFVQWDEFVEEHGLRIASQRTHAMGLGLFLDFVAARSEEFYGELKLLRKLHRSFSEALLVGTVVDGDCPHKLWWHCRTVSSVNKILRALNRYLTWVSGNEASRLTVLGRDASPSDQIKFWAKWRYRKQHSLLGHLKHKSRELAIARQVQLPELGRASVSTSRVPKRFPHDHFQALLNQGFRRRAEVKWSSLRDRMIVLLLHGGGLRLSEALAMWINDVYPDPEDSSAVIVRLYEPHEGIVRHRDPTTGNVVRITRAHYLKQKHNILPLSMQPGNRHIGSKSNLYDDTHDKYSLVYWRDPSYGRAFKRLYSEYVLLRPRPDNHPFLFITPSGQSMTLKGFEKVHAAAVRRINLIPSSSLGTTPHGHRHDYAHCLRSSGVSEKIIQIAMHHRAVASQEVYGNLTPIEAAHSIRMLANKPPVQLN